MVAIIGTYIIKAQSGVETQAHVARGSGDNQGSTYVVGIQLRYLYMYFTNTDLIAWCTCRAGLVCGCMCP